MNTDECMEYSQKYANAQGSKDRNEARGELRKQINMAVAAAVSAERERCAVYCGTLAQIMECGAGELEPGGRLRQAEQTIRSGRHWPPNVL